MSLNFKIFKNFLLKSNIISTIIFHKFLYLLQKKDLNNCSKIGGIINNYYLFYLNNFNLDKINDNYL